MRRLRYLLWLALLAILAGGYFILRSFGMLGTPLVAGAKVVPKGDQEIAYIQAATSGSTWERLVAGIRRVQKSWPELIIEDANAVPEQSAAVPEVAVRLAGSEHRVWFRWYKMSSEAGIEKWVGELAGREPAPLALIGGGSSDRAWELAGALASQKSWRGPAPLLLITTATADHVYEEGELPIGQPLMERYPGKTFRFCFTNSQMAAALRDFVWRRDDFRPHGRPSLLVPGLAQAVSGQLWESLPLLTFGTTLQGPLIRVFEWADDPYSVDLSEQFRAVFRQGADVPMAADIIRVPYSVGGFFLPNRWEAMGIRMLISAAPDQRQLLVLPAVDRPARRVLRGLTQLAPQELDNIVTVTGDSISFNTVYRDRNVAWNILDMPVRLLFFCHHNPVAWPQAPLESPGDEGLALGGSAAGTDDALLYAEIVRFLLEAILPASADAPPTLLASADQLAQKLRQREPAYFGPDGNRTGSGEFVVCLLPTTVASRVLPEATLEIWTRSAAGDKKRWEHVKSLRLDYEGGGEGLGNAP